MIFYDIDGVLRNLAGIAFGREPKMWQEKINGKGVFKIVNENKQMLLDALPTIYVPIIQELEKISILSTQPAIWREYTGKWLDKYFPNTLIEENYTLKPEKKLEFLKEGDILIDDYPLFSNYSKVAVVDCLYNQNVKDCYMRIKTVEDLEELLKKKGGD
jgi:hypothetical protein